MWLNSEPIETYFRVAKLSNKIRKLALEKFTVFVEAKSNLNLSNLIFSLSFNCIVF